MKKMSQATTAGSRLGLQRCSRGAEVSDVFFQQWLDIQKSHGKWWKCRLLCWQKETVFALQAFCQQKLVTWWLLSWMQKLTVPSLWVSTRRWWVWAGSSSTCGHHPDICAGKTSQSCTKQLNDSIQTKSSKGECQPSKYFTLDISKTKATPNQNHWKLGNPGIWCGYVAGSTICFCFTSQLTGFGETVRPHGLVRGHKGGPTGPFFKRTTRSTLA